MPPTAPSEQRPARFELKPEERCVARLVLSGWLDADSTGDLWRELDLRLRHSPANRRVEDVAAVDYCDGAGLALLHFLDMSGISPDDPVSLRRMSTPAKAFQHRSGAVPQRSDD